MCRALLADPAPGGGLEGLLVVVAPPAGTPNSPESLDRELSALLQEPSPGSICPYARTAALLSLLSERAEWCRDAGRGAVGVVCIWSGRYYAAQSGGAPIYLLRAGLLQPLPRRFAAGDEALETEVTSGELREGDALLVCSRSLLDALTGEEVRLALCRSYLPASAAARLLDAARGRGCLDASVGVLFVGSGPSVPVRNVPPELPHPGPRPPAPLAAGSAASRRPPAERALGVIAVLTAAAGAVFGVGLGIGIAAFLNRAARPSGPPPDAAAVLPRVVSPLPPTAGSPAWGGGARPAAVGADVSYRGTPAVEGAPAAARTPAAAARAALPGSEQPPRHSLAQGMRARIDLHVHADLDRGLLVLRASQGVLSVPATAVSPGEPLAVPVPPTLREQLADGRGELRLAAPGGGLRSVLSGGALLALLAGRPAPFTDIQPGTYRLEWWHPAGAGGLPEPLPLRLEYL